MQFTLSIHCDGEVSDGTLASEIASILRSTSYRVRGQDGGAYEPVIILDRHGNNIGAFTLSKDVAAADAALKQPLRNLLRRLHNLGTSDIYTDAEEYEERVHHIRALFAQLEKVLID